MKTLHFALVALAITYGVAACGGSDGSPIDTDSGTTGNRDAGSSGGSDAGAQARDAGFVRDAGGPPRDAGSTPRDAGFDAHAAPDAGVPVDAGHDAAHHDSGPAETALPGECDMERCTPTCFRAISCVTACGGPVTACGCCQCKDTSFDPIECAE